MTVKAMDESKGVVGLLIDLLDPKGDDEETLIGPEKGAGEEYPKADPCPISSSKSFRIWGSIVSPFRYQHSRRVHTHTRRPNERYRSST